MYKFIWMLIALMGISGKVVAQTEHRDAFTEDFLPVWERAQSYMLAVAEAMPEEKYSYQPTPEVFSFGQQIMHVAANLQSLTASYIQGTQVEAFDSKAEGKTKEEIIQHLKDAFVVVNQAMKSLPEGAEEDEVLLFNKLQVNKKRVFLLMRDHMTHHRAQMILYLRLNGIEPPAYVGW